tara:strand:- start:756 stop:1028 length:273 start_codon:yes stop_codon:yes gene_type:complete
VYSHPDENPPSRAATGMSGAFCFQNVDAMEAVIAQSKSNGCRHGALGIGVGGTEDIHADRVAGGSLCRQTRSLERRKAEPEIEDGDKQRN